MKTRAIITAFSEQDEVKVVVEKREWGLPQTSLSHITNQVGHSFCLDTRIRISGQQHPFLSSSTQGINWEVRRC